MEAPEARPPSVTDRANAALGALRQRPLWVYAVIVVAYVVYCLHQPLGLFANAGHDDWWFISHARFLLDGRWMGPYSNFTLMKGPGFIFFLAANHWLGTPVSLTLALFYVLGCGALVASLGRAARLSPVWRFVVFNVVLWHPAMVSYRVYRDEIYPGLVLLVLAAAVALTFSETGRRILLPAISLGLTFGYLWITREEGVWMVPGLGLLGVVSLLRARRQGKTAKMALAWLLACVIAALPSIAVASINQHVYGTFTVVDFTGRPFQGAVKALDSIEAGPERRYVSVSDEALHAAYDVSPAARELQPYFDNPAGYWRWTDCSDKTYPCGEIISGWFVWALRDAVSSAGHYSSAADADNFYERLTREINEACDAGELTCRSNPIPLLPAMSGSDLAHVPGSVGQIIERTVRLDTIDTVHPGPSAGYPKDLSYAIELTGRPLMYPTVESKPHYKVLETPGLQMRSTLESVYRPLTWVVSGLGVLALLAGLVLLWLRRPVARRVLVVSWAAWVLYLTRVGVLALVDATSFPVTHAMYIGPAYTMLLLASLLSVAAVLPALRAGRAHRGPRDRRSPRVRTPRRRAERLRSHRADNRGAEDGQMPPSAGGAADVRETVSDSR
jgi:hypothetical protein